MDNLSLGMVSQSARRRGLFGLGAWDWESISNTANKILDLGQKTAETVQAFKQPSGSSTYIPTSSGPYPMLDPEQLPPPKEGLSTGAKVAIGVGSVAAVGGLVYLATRKKRRK